MRNAVCVGDNARLRRLLSEFAHENDGRRIIASVSFRFGGWPSRLWRLQPPTPSSPVPQSNTCHQLCYTAEQTVSPLSPIGVRYGEAQDFCQSQFARHGLPLLGLWLA